MLNSHDPAKMHIQDTTLNGINRAAANGRISAAVADRHREDDAGNMSIQISRSQGRLKWRLSQRCVNIVRVAEWTAAAVSTCGRLIFVYFRDWRVRFVIS